MAGDLSARIAQAALPQQMADGSISPTLTITQIEELAIRFGLEGKSVEIAALENGVFPERYTRNLKTYNAQSRAGVGQMRLVDGDRFESHNLNRQLLSTQDRIGSFKAEVAAERVCSINGSISVEAHTDFLQLDNAARLISGSDAVVDCLDDIEARFTLESAAKAAGIPMVSAAVAGVSGQVTTIYPQDEGLKLIYGPEKSLSSAKGVELSLGCLPQAVALIAAAQCSEILKILLGREDQLLRNQMLLVDMSANTFDTLTLT
ncbi:MAG: ThiF family adenylyltransferase [Desulfobacteraceae bacterium]